MPTFVSRQHVPNQGETCRWQSTKAVPVCLTKLSPNPFSVPLAAAAVAVGGAGLVGAAVLSVEAKSIPKSATVASCALARDSDWDWDRDWA